MASDAVTPQPRDPLAVDQEPTDEELAEVMNDVMRAVLEDRARADLRMREMMAADLLEATSRMVYLLEKIKLPRR